MDLITTYSLEDAHSLQCWSTFIEAKIVGPLGIIIAVLIVPKRVSVHSNGLSLLLINSDD